MNENNELLVFISVAVRWRKRNKQRQRADGGKEEKDVKKKGDEEGRVWREKERESNCEMALTKLFRRSL